MKLIFIRLVCCFILLPVFQRPAAQIMSGVDAGGAIPVGNLSSYSSGGISLAIAGKFFVVERVAIGFNAGWQYFFGKNNGNFSIIPLRVTGEYYFKDEGARIRPYAGADLGLYIDSYTGAIRLKFGVAPGGGVQFELSDAVNLGIGVKYNIIAEQNPAMYIEPKISLLYVFGMY